jgi:dTDP-4-amino-4,6-dideoxygalactose transaminase
MSNAIKRSSETRQRSVHRLSKSALRKRSMPKLGLGVMLIGKEEKALVLDVLRRKSLFLYYGRDPKNPPPMAATLEREFREKIGTKFALAVSSGTAALEVALGALGVGPGDEVIIPVWSWVSCFTSVVRVGARPVLAEIDDTLCISPEEIARLVTPRTKVVMVVHYQGVAADMDRILSEARKAKIAVIEDCAESPGVTYRGRRVGSMGDIGTFSFQDQKSMTSGEGGMVTTNDPVLYERAVRMHDLGSLRAYHGHLVTESVTAFCGSQFRMTELQAAVALAQLRKLDALRTRCRRSRDRIMRRISSLPRLQFRRVPDPAGDTGFEIYFWLATPQLAEQFQKRLTRWNVYAAKTTGTTCHYVRPYCQIQAAHAASASPFAAFEQWPAAGYRDKDFPQSEDLISRFIALPIGVLFTDADADYIAEVVCRVHAELNRDPQGKT